MPRHKPAPGFENGAAERAYWETDDSAEHVDLSEAERVRFPNLNPSTTAISLHLSVNLPERVGIAAIRRDIPYQSPVKAWLAKKVGR